MYLDLKLKRFSLPIKTGKKNNFSTKHGSYLFILNFFFCKLHFIKN